MKYNIRNKYCKELDCFAQNGKGKCTILEETYEYWQDCPFYKERTVIDQERAAEIQTYRYATKRANDLHDEFLKAREHVEEIKREMSEARTARSKYKQKIKERMRKEALENMRNEATV